MVIAGTENGYMYFFGDYSVPWTSFIIRNMPGQHSPQKTVVVIGQAIGGTSAVAAAIDALGVTMGDENSLRSGGAFENAGMMNAATQEATINDYNSKYDVWGWKNPAGISMINLLPRVRHPYCVFVARDPIAMASRYAVARKVSVEEAIMTCSTDASEIIKAAATTEYPSLLVSYERMKTTPELFVRAFSAFLDITPTPEQWCDAIGRVSRQGGYVHMPGEFGPGPGNRQERSNTTTQEDS